MLLLLFALPQTIELASNACKELYECKDFAEVLGFVLSIGNYLNAGTKRGGAYGFQLSTLIKVGQCDCKLMEFVL